MSGKFKSDYMGGGGGEGGIMRRSDMPLSCHGVAYVHVKVGVCIHVFALCMKEGCVFQIPPCKPLASTYIYSRDVRYPGIHVARSLNK